jgi:hypothetical protein
MLSQIEKAPSGAAYSRQTNTMSLLTELENSWECFATNIPSLTGLAEFSSPNLNANPILPLHFLARAD